MSHKRRLKAEAARYTVNMKTKRSKQIFILSYETCLKQNKKPRRLHSHGSWSPPSPVGEVDELGREYPPLCYPHEGAHPTGHDLLLLRSIHIWGRLRGDTHTKKKIVSWKEPSNIGSEQQ